MAGLWTNNRFEAFLKRAYGWKVHGAGIAEVSQVISPSVDLEQTIDNAELLLPGGVMACAASDTALLVAASVDFQFRNPAGSNRIMMPTLLEMFATVTIADWLLLSAPLSAGAGTLVTTNADQACLDLRRTIFANKGPAGRFGHVTPTSFGASVDQIGRYSTLLNDPKSIDLRGYVLPPNSALALVIPSAVSGTVSVNIRWREREADRGELAVKI